MKTFAELHRRLIGLVSGLDGEVWDNLLASLNPPREIPRDSMIQDLAFRDAKALGGYVPDLRKVMKDTSPKDLAAEEYKAFCGIAALYNLAARLPVVLLSIPDYAENQNLIELYNGYRQTLSEIFAYLALAEKQAGGTPAG
ncbi:MAG: hypothetical protein LBT40_04485 [Deltaproteobacteria bacterium]|jgi:hypothetical protein|nr:hypothetical protein [Deltaproteobacteria bacterium]